MTGGELRNKETGRGNEEVGWGEAGDETTI